MIGTERGKNKFGLYIFILCILLLSQQKFIVIRASLFSEFFVCDIYGRISSMKMLNVFDAGPMRIGRMT